MPDDVLVIHLWPRESECIACGAPLFDCRQGIPVYESLALPDDWPGEWGGFDACPRCAALQAALAKPVPLALLAPPAGLAQEGER